MRSGSGSGSTDAGKERQKESQKRIIGKGERVMPTEKYLINDIPTERTRRRSRKRDRRKVVGPVLLLIGKCRRQTWPPSEWKKETPQR